MQIPTFQQLKTMMSEHSIVKAHSSKFKEYPFGFRGGNYLGAPGKDIFFALPSLTDEQLIDLAHALADLFPSSPPNNHVRWAACIRYVYGCFEKQGCLRSKKDKKRMIGEDASWSLPMDFMNLVSKRFKRKKNLYGLVIHYEMKAHRIGDRAVIENDPEKLPGMIRYYSKSYKLAQKIHSWKHHFTPWYWGASYYATMGDKENAIKYHWLNLQNMERYCPDARPGYREKALASIAYLKKHSSSKEWKGYANWIKRCRNKCLKKIKGAAK